MSAALATKAKKLGKRALAALAQAETEARVRKLFDGIEQKSAYEGGRGVYIFPWINGQCMASVCVDLEGLHEKVMAVEGVRSFRYNID